MLATLSNWFQLLFCNYLIKLKFVCVCLIVVVSGQSFFIPAFNVLVTVYPFLINFPLFKLFSTSTRPYCGISLLLFYENFPRFIQLVSKSLVTYAIASHPIRSYLLSPSASPSSKISHPLNGKLSQSTAWFQLWLPVPSIYSAIALAYCYYLYTSPTF